MNLSTLLLFCFTQTRSPFALQSFFLQFAFTFLQFIVISHIFEYICIYNMFYTGTLSVEQIYQDRESFASLVREVAAPDVGRMGIEILSFVIKDVVDNVDYLSSIGRAQSAIVKKDAAIGVAEAERDSGIVVSAKLLIFFQSYVKYLVEVRAYVIVV